MRHILSLVLLTSLAFADETVINPPTPQTSGGFGFDVACDSTGTLLAVIDSQNFYIYEDAGSGFTLTTSFIENGPTAVSVNDSGTTIVVGNAASFTPTASVYQKVGGSWLLATTLFSPSSYFINFFGFDVAVDNDNTIVVGAPITGGPVTILDGEVHIFEEQAGSWQLTGSFFGSPGLGNPAQFGISVDISGDSIVVGAPADDTAAVDSGAMHFFQRAAGAWSANGTLVGSTSSLNFGQSVTLEGANSVAASLGHSTLYHFEQSAGVWSEVQTIQPGDLGTNFGETSLQLRGGRLMASCLTPFVAVDSGAFYLYDLGAGQFAPAGRHRVASLLLRKSGRAGALADNRVIAGDYEYDGTFSDEGVVYVSDAPMSGGSLAAFEFGFCDSGQGPCGNDREWAGCVNSTGGGALLSAVGNTSVTDDELELHCTGIPPGKFMIFFMGDATASIPLFDGLRVISGTTQRFPVIMSTADGTATLGPGIVATSQGFPMTSIDPGETWYFQTWFRDTNQVCGNRANTSSGIGVTFTP